MNLITMDNSQSSGCFFESADISFMANTPAMDILSYQSQVAKTKQALNSTSKIDLQKSSFATYFSSLLEDCSICINQSLDLVSGLQADTKVCSTKLLEYLNDAVCLLQLLTEFLKNVTESVTMVCSSMNTFPTTTGHIIYTVFNHCKDSEALYGKNLSRVEKQLKDLFRNCHELQLTYLVILEKHLIFDLTEQEEKNILNEAFHINLKIGEIVHSLDVKTMAEQWKAYTTICEKYSHALLETSIFQDCTQVLCMLIRNNIKTAIENTKDDKLVMRSLKVTSFTIKILLKICSIFRDAVRNDYANVLDAIFYMQIAGFTLLELTAEQSQFKNLINVSLVNPSECLLKELLSDETFCNSLLTYNLDTIKNAQDSLGFVLTITSAIKCLTQGYRNKAITKIKFINCVYSFLPHDHLWLKHDIKLKLESDRIETHGLFEHLLIHTVALAYTLNSEEFILLERHMIETILGTDCCSALFSSNLWAMMVRHVSPQLLFNQLVWLCTMYKKLENHKMFNRSPQKVHLSYTISRLFEVTPEEDKMKICKQFRIHDDDNVSLWIALGVNNLPDEVKNAAVEVVAEKLKTQFQCFSEDAEGIIKLVQVISLAASCTFTNTRGVEDCVIKAWSKTCPQHHFTIQGLDQTTVWFYDYLEALVNLTDSIWHRICDKNVQLSKLLHWMTCLIAQCNTEFKLILTKTLCKLATSEISQSKRVLANFTQAFTCILRDSEDIVRHMLFTTLKKYKCNKILDRILSNIEKDSLQECWSKIKNGQSCSELKDNLITIKDCKYRHKCFKEKIIPLSSSSVSELKKASSSNFDFADMDTVFEHDNESEEPLCKKVKLNANEAEVIIKRLEADASLLCKVKENVFTNEYKNRVQNVCDKLLNIVN